MSSPASLVSKVLTSLPYMSIPSGAPSRPTTVSRRSSVPRRTSSSWTTVPSPRVRPSRVVPSRCRVRRSGHASRPGPGRLALGRAVAQRPERPDAAAVEGDVAEHVLGGGEAQPVVVDAHVRAPGAWPSGQSWPVVTPDRGTGPGSGRRDGCASPAPGRRRRRATRRGRSARRSSGSFFSGGPNGLTSSRSMSAVISSSRSTMSPPLRSQLVRAARPSEVNIACRRSATACEVVAVGELHVEHEQLGVDLEGALDAVRGQRPRRRVPLEGGLAHQRQELGQPALAQDRLAVDQRRLPGDVVDDVEAHHAERPGGPRGRRRSGAATRAPWGRRR